MLHPLILSFIETLSVQKRLSRLTLQAYQADMVDFWGFMTQHRGKPLDIQGLSELALRDFRGWFAARVERGVSARSNARALSVLRSFYRFLDQQEMCQNHTVFSLKRPRFSSHLPRAIEHPTVEHLMDATQNEDHLPWIQARNFALLTLLYGTGLRLGEALSLNQNIFPLQESIMVWGKGQKQRLIPLIPWVRHALNCYRALCPLGQEASDPLFFGTQGRRLHPSVAQGIMRILRRALGLPEHATPHALRHSFATVLLREGVDLRTLQDLLGHASLSSTQIYAHADIQHILKSYTASHPLSGLDTPPVKLKPSGDDTF